MLQRTRDRLTVIVNDTLADDEHVECMAHLLSRSGASIARNAWRISSLPPTVEFAVLTNRRLLIVAADSQGRPTGKIVREMATTGLRVIGRGGGYIRWVDLEYSESPSFRFHIPRIARREGELLFQALPGNATSQ